MDIKSTDNQNIVEGEFKAIETTPIEKQTIEQETKINTVAIEPKPTADPTVEKTEEVKTKEAEKQASEPAREMNAEQFEVYNETLRKISKNAKADLNSRYNAFEDNEVKALVKSQILEGNKPDPKAITQEIVTKLMPKSESKTEKSTAAQSDEVKTLETKIALLKLGITAERIEAATKLFIAEGHELEKANQFVEKYSEWKAVKPNKENAIVFTKAQPLNDRTAPKSNDLPVMNDFERAVYNARKARGLPT